MCLSFDTSPFLSIEMLSRCNHGTPPIHVPYSSHIQSIAIGRIWEEYGKKIECNTCYSPEIFLQTPEIPKK